MVKISCRYLRGGTQCSVIITGLLIFTVYFFYLLYFNSQENLAYISFELCEKANRALFCFLSDARLWNGELFSPNSIFFGF